MNPTRQVVLIKSTVFDCDNDNHQTTKKMKRANVERIIKTIKKKKKMMKIML